MGRKADEEAVVLFSIAGDVSVAIGEWPRWDALADSRPSGLVEGRNSLDVSAPRTVGQTN
jgi:hypothetical protein